MMLNEQANGLLRNLYDLAKRDGREKYFPAFDVGAILGIADRNAIREILHILENNYLVQVLWTRFPGVKISSDGILAVEKQHSQPQRIQNDDVVPEHFNGIKILFFAANPKDQARLDLDEEIRLIKQKIKASKYRDYVEIASEWAVRTDDVLQALNEQEPDIVHFSGHGDENSDIILLDSEGLPKPVRKEALAAAMTSCNENLRVIVFNTCFSSEQAKEIVKSIDVAIGMGAEIGDEAARVFSAQFYSAIGFGFSVRKAFFQAKAALMLEGTNEEMTPVLYAKDGVDPKDVVLVKNSK